MSEPRPRVVILAGPNGAGKSTAAPALLQGTLAVNELVNADVIARGLSAFDPEAAALAAGRVMLTRLRTLAAQRVSLFRVVPASFVDVEAVQRFRSKAQTAGRAIRVTAAHRLR